MKEKLSKRLEEIGISRKGIIDLIAPEADMSVVIYASCMDGLGTKASDFDIYVIGDDIYKKKGILVNNGQGGEMLDLDPLYYEMEDAAYLYLDIQYWEINTLDELANRVKANKNIGFEELKMLYRLLEGEYLHQGKFVLEEKLSFYDLQKNVQRKFAFASDGLLHDCISLYKEKEYFGAIQCGRKALDYAAAGVNASMGKINLKIEKWNSKIFLLQDVPASEKNEFVYLMYGKAEFTETYIERLIVFVQNILNKKLDFLGKKHWLYKENYVLLDESKDVLHRIH